MWLSCPLHANKLPELEGCLNTGAAPSSPRKLDTAQSSHPVTTPHETSMETTEVKKALCVSRAPVGKGSLDCIPGYVDS